MNGVLDGDKMGCGNVVGVVGSSCGCFGTKRDCKVFDGVVAKVTDRVLVDSFLFCSCRIFSKNRSNVDRLDGTVGDVVDSFCFDCNCFITKRARKLTRFG